MNRVTQQTIYQNTLLDTRRLTDQIANLQTQVSTGNRLLNVSDDPAASLSILAGDAQDQSITAHLENLKSARSTLDLGVSTLQQVAAIFNQAHSVAIDAANSANGTTSFGALANQVDGMITQLLGLANTKQNQTYLFGGATGGQTPFAVTSQDAQGKPLMIAYQGSTGNVSTLVDQNQSVAIYYPGNDVFMQRSRGATVFNGSTGAKPGDGTDTAAGQTELTFQHTSTTFALGSGVQVGTNSAAGDTILGTHRLTIVDTSGTGASGTISLDGGTPVAFTNADANLRVVNTNGDAVFLNATTITAGFNGDVAATANGTMSADGGVTSTPMTFAANDIAKDSRTGLVTFVDTTNMKRTGKEIVDHAGAYDAFQTLMALRDDLRNVHQLSQKDQIDAISRHIGEIDRSRNSDLDTVGKQSAALASLDSVESHLNDIQLTIKKNVGTLKSVDLADAVVKLQSFSQMLQLSLSTYAKVVNQNLLDFLR